MASLDKLWAYLEDYRQDPWVVLRLTIRLSALCILISLVLSPNLWFQEGRDFLPSPFVPALADAPAVINHILYALTAIVCIWLFFEPKMKRIGIVLLPVFLYFVAQDQMRAQFYHVMMFFNLIAASLLPADTAKIEDRHLDPLRYMAIGVYFWGGAHKISLFFVKELFPGFVAAWIPNKEFAQFLGMFVPFFELSIGLFLLFPATVRLAQLMAATMLAVVLLSLGPTGYNDAMNIWPVNVYLDCLAIFLFSAKKRPLLSFCTMKKMPVNFTSAALFWFLPVLGLFNITGSHPSLKLYCGCPGQPLVYLNFGEKEDAARLARIIPYTLYRERRLYAASLTRGSLQLTSSVVKAGAEPFTDGMKGFCAAALYPEDVRLVLKEPVSRWTSETKETRFELCKKPQAPN